LVTVGIVRLVAGPYKPRRNGDQAYVAGAAWVATAEAAAVPAQGGGFTVPGVSFPRPKRKRYDWDQPQPEKVTKRVKKPKKKEVKKAISVLAKAEYLPVYFAISREIIEERPFAELMKDAQDLDVVMEAYEAYIQWQIEDEEDVETILLLLN